MGVWGRADVVRVTLHLQRTELNRTFEFTAFIRVERAMSHVQGLQGAPRSSGFCTSALNQAQIDEIDPFDGPCGSGGRYQPTGHMSGVYTPSGGR